MIQLLNPLRLHLFSYRKFYLSFLIITILEGLFLFLFKESVFVYYSACFYLTISFVFTFLFGIYEYKKICYNYLNIKTNRQVFYFSSLIFNIINALFFCVLLFILTTFTDFIYSSNSYVNLSTYGFIAYLYIFVSYILIFVVASCYSLIINSKFVDTAFIILIMIIIVVYKDLINSFMLDKFFISIEWLTKNSAIMFGLIIIAIIFYIVSYLEIIKLNVKNKKK